MDSSLDEHLVDTYVSFEFQVGIPKKVKKFVLVAVNVWCSFITCQIVDVKHHLCSVQAVFFFCKKNSSNEIFVICLHFFSNRHINERDVIIWDVLIAIIHGTFYENF
jgi:hypothetical protein